MPSSSSPHAHHRTSCRSLMPASSDVGPVHVDDRSRFIQFNSDQFAFFHSLCLLSFFRQRKHLLAGRRLQLDLLFHPTDVDEFTGHLSMRSFLPFEVHVNDVVVLIQHNDHVIPRFERLLPVTPRHIFIELMYRTVRCRHHERTGFFVTTLVNSVWPRARCSAPIAAWATGEAMESAASTVANARHRNV